MALGPRTDDELDEDPLQSPSAPEPTDLGSQDNLLEQVFCILLMFCPQGDQFFLSSIGER